MISDYEDLFGESSSDSVLSAVLVEHAVEPYGSVLKGAPPVAKVTLKGLRDHLRDFFQFSTRGTSIIPFVQPVAGEQQSPTIAPGQQQQIGQVRSQPMELDEAINVLIGFTKGGRKGKKGKGQQKGKWKGQPYRGKNWSPGKGQGQGQWRSGREGNWKGQQQQQGQGQYPKGKWRDHRWHDGQGNQGNQGRGGHQHQQPRGGVNQVGDGQSQQQMPVSGSQQNTVVRKVNKVSSSVPMHSDPDLEDAATGWVFQIVESDGDESSDESETDDEYTTTDVDPEASVLEVVVEEDEDSEDEAGNEEVAHIYIYIYIYRPERNEI